MDRGHAAGQVPIADLAEPGIPDHFREEFLPREAADRFDQIFVRLARAGRQFAEPGNDLEGMKIIEPVEAGDFNLRKLEAEEPPARPQDSEGLAKCPVDVRDVADAKRNRIGVETAGLERQLLGVAFDQFDLAGQTGLLDATTAETVSSRTLVWADISAPVFEVAEQMIGINRKLGVNHLILSMEWAGMEKSVAMDCMQMMAEDVMPRVRQGV